MGSERCRSIQCVLTHRRMDAAALGGSERTYYNLRVGLFSTMKAAGVKMNNPLRMARNIGRRKTIWGRRRAILRWCEAMKKELSQVRGVS